MYRTSPGPVFRCDYFCPCLVSLKDRSRAQACRKRQKRPSASAADNVPRSSAARGPFIFRQSPILPFHILPTQDDRARADAVTAKLTGLFVHYMHY